ncbi:CDC42 small effector protein homolog [Ctenocephalides felis]|uniref:CDC42 small effector protein homolog n=1 Tax=Ctenocephalides felis TaxID=7515 RepID=UPI000E6E293B|nr:CDC42 small effector protein homolog [Ctenocephalides felis]XP_026477790.1 CDC42 small effector protein homolog [Ctenocephalides felis]
MATTASGDLWLQWFTCCVNPAASSSPPAVARHKAAQHRRRIDRAAIGPPTNFQHTGHIGSGSELLNGAHLTAVQNQMQGKGGYGAASFGLKAC